MKRQFLSLLCVTALSGALILSGCSKGGGKAKSNDSSGGTRETTTSTLMPEASGEVVYGGDTISIDASNTADGYVMVKYTGAADKIQVQITNPDGTLYQYPLPIGDYQTLPLTGGDGSYQIDVLEHVSDDMYSVGLSQPVDVALTDEFRPYLYPNQYVNYTPDSAAVSLGVDISNDSSDDLDFVTNVYEYVTENISYDNEKAADISVNYIPDVDATLESKTGICFDYASVMSAMLRSQSVPTKLEVGYSGTAYHAWISVYLAEQGWVDDIIQFNGQNWSLMDPTLAANNDDESVKDYVGDGSNYTTKYTY
ncbi:MAG: transglutaminase domain-containing protein [Lachnospiraceae bacterium]|nr:transglutaminase domain-containing protein [Lachnospiraceae bacterium]